MTDKAMITPIPSDENVREAMTYLVRLADWAAGQGFCQIEGLPKDPDEWCFDMWSQLRPDSDGSDYSADALADALATAALKAKEQ